MALLVVLLTASPVTCTYTFGVCRVVAKSELCFRWPAGESPVNESSKCRTNAGVSLENPEDVVHPSEWFTLKMPPGVVKRTAPGPPPKELEVQRPSLQELLWFKAILSVGSWRGSKEHRTIAVRLRACGFYFFFLDVQKVSRFRKEEALKYPR